jgi:class 3 adenylate cyclase
MFPVVEQHRGAVVKLMGDAIMAAFVHERDALAAALSMLRAYDALGLQNPDAQQSGLKVGVHVGPCYAVTANGVFDYFGQNVNLAARLQGEAAAAQLVVAQELADQAYESGWLDDARVIERFVAQLKGIGEPVRAARIVLARLGTTLQRGAAEPRA